MLLRQLQYFLDLAETEHLTKTASNLFVTQSTISHGISQLENELGVQLFERIGRGLAISQAGMKFKPYAIKALDELSAGRMELLELTSLQKGLLTVGVIPTFLTSIIPLVVTKFTKMYPGIDISIRDMRADLIEEQLICASLDLGIAFHPTKRAEITADHLFDEKLVLLVGSDHKLAKLNVINIKDLANVPLCLLPKTYATRRLIDDSFKKAKVIPKISVEIESVNSLIETSSYGNLATIVPERAVPSVKKFQVIELKNPTPIRRAGILRRKGASTNRICTAFIDTLKTID